MSDLLAEPESLVAESGLAEDDTAADRTVDVVATRQGTTGGHVLGAVGLTTIAAAIMVGGVFLGTASLVYAGVAGIAGMGIAVGASRLASRPLLSNSVIVGGLFLTGVVLAAAGGVGNVARISTLVSEAVSSRAALRPPVELTAGWQAIIGWLMGTTGFFATWIAILFRRPSLGVMVPLPLAAIAGISVPDNAQVASGLAMLVLLAVALALLARAHSLAGDEERPPLGHEFRRGARALPLIAVVTVGLYALSRTSFLFPAPLIDPAQEPQKPKTVPLSEVADRVLFEVESMSSGPWRIGSLDVYDGRDWRLPPFAESELLDVPADGNVDPDLEPGTRATFTVAGLEGAVLPGLPNPVGIVADGPRLAFDDRNSVIRLAQGQIQPGLVYTVAAASLPSIEQLRSITVPVPEDVRRFLEISDPPPGVAQLLQEAPTGSAWDTFDFLRTRVLETVAATGQGVPVSITPERVDEMLFVTAEASPFEIVAAQAMLARWAGVPSRIGYGFDGGEVVDERLQVRPRHGATFVEVYFPGYKWLPVLGTPLKAKATVGDTSESQVDPRVLPSEEIGVQLYLPVVTPGIDRTLSQLRWVVLVIVSLAALVALAYFTLPVLRKARLRSRRRAAAVAAGPRARIAQAYAEWRDTVADFGYGYRSDTPLHFLDRFAPDDEHIELAWLVTRTLWGNLQVDIDPAFASAAEELSRSLRRRLSQAHPATVRMVAAMSRTSVRDPYDPSLDDEGAGVSADGVINEAAAGIDRGGRERVDAHAH